MFGVGKARNLKLGTRNFGVVDNVLVDLVSEAQRIKLFAQPGDEFHLVSCEDFSCRIVWIADYDRLCFFIEGGPKLVAIEYETFIRSIKRNEARTCTGDDRVRHVVFVIRIEDDYLLAGIDRRHRGCDHALG